MRYFPTLCLLLAGHAAWSADNLVFVPLAPCRVIDTRVAGAGGPLAAGTPRNFVFRGPTRNYQNPAPFANQGGSTTGCGIPDLGSSGGSQQNLAEAVAINIIAVAPSGPGDLRAWPANQGAPAASVINYTAVAGLNLANGVIVQMCNQYAAAPCTGGDIAFLADVSGTYLVVDVLGYFHPGSKASTLTNAALGAGALTLNSSGINNTAFGASALLLNTTGSENTAVGASALANFASVGNTAAGFQALNAQTSDYSTGLGWNALQHATGTRNTAVGAGALQNLSTGTENVAVGVNAGLNWNGSEDHNVIIGGDVHGVAGESYTTRIGSPEPPVPGLVTGTYITHIWGYTADGQFPIPVYVDTAGHLGTDTSSRRFKEDIADMGEASAGLMRLRPVTFHFDRAHDDGSRVLQYGLIAEEVAEVYPDIVAYGKDGQPLTLRYQSVDAMMLNEVQKLHREIEALRARAAEQEARIEKLEALVGR